MTKRLLALFMVFVMCFSFVLPASAFASDEMDADVLLETAIGDTSDIELVPQDNSVSTDADTETADVPSEEELEDTPFDADDVNEIDIDDDSDATPNDDNDDAVDIVAEEASDEINKTSEEISEESEVDEDITLQSFAKDYDIDAVSWLDFSSYRILVSASSYDIVQLTEDAIIGSFDNLYLMQFDDQNTAKLAYLYYNEHADYADIDRNFVVADFAAVGEMSENANPFDELEEAIDSANLLSTNQCVVAVIDTGISGIGNVISAYSVLGDTTADDNGHGTTMAAHIVTENPNVKIVSIKAFDASGYGTISSVYAAIELAVEVGADVINMSFYAPQSERTYSINEAINDAISSGITIIAAAGNSSRDASGYIPAAVPGVVTVGSVSDNGTLASFSNYGSAVDYYLVSGSTSAAAAIASGIYSRHRSFTPDIEAGRLFINYKDISEVENLSLSDLKEQPIEYDIYGNELDAVEVERDETISEMEIDASKTVLVKYLYADATMIEKGATIDSLQYEHKEALYSCDMVYANAYKMEDGTYKVEANVPFLNGFAVGNAYDVVFANGNFDGQVITEGVSFDKESYTATIDASVLEMEDGDFADLQIQILVPTTLNRLSEITVHVANELEDLDVVAPSLVKIPAFDQVDFSVVEAEDAGKINAANLLIYINGEKEPLAPGNYYYNTGTGDVTIAYMASSVFSVDITIQETEWFEIAYWDDYWGYVPDASYTNYGSGRANPSVYLAPGTDSDRFVVGNFEACLGRISLSGHMDGRGGSSQISSSTEEGNIPIATTSASTGYALGLPTHMFGGDFQFYNDKNGSSSKGKWSNTHADDNGKSYNHAFGALCVHVSAQRGSAANATDRYMWTNVRVLKKTTEYNDGCTWVLMSFITWKEWTGTATKGVGQAVGGTFWVGFREDAGWLSIQKEAEEANASVEGVKFNLCKEDGSVVETFVTNASGQGISTETGKNYTKLLNADKYYFEEIEANSDLRVNENKFWVNLYTGSRGDALNESLGEYASNAQYSISSKYSDYDNWWLVTVTDPIAQPEPPTPTTVDLRVHKMTDPDYEDIVENNACYSLAGATYGVYASKANANSDTDRLATLTTGEDGVSDTVSLIPGTYYVKELSASTGYEVDAKVHDITVVTGKPTTLQVDEVPGNDPFRISLEKKNKSYDATVIPSLAGAKFVIEYFGGYFDTIEEAEAAGVLHRTWTIQTKQRPSGAFLATLNNTYIVADESDDWFAYNNDFGLAYIPYGTIVVWEKTPATGYDNDPSFLLENNGEDHTLFDANGIPYIILHASEDEQFSSVKTSNSIASDAEFTVRDTLTPKMSSTLLAKNGTHYSANLGTTQITDTLHLSELNDFVGKEFTFTDWLVDENGNLLVVNGVEQKQTKTVTINRREQEVSFTFTFDPKDLGGKTVTAMADLYYDGDIYVPHEDLNDVEQKVTFPKIGTTLTDKITRNDISFANGLVTLYDTVSYEGLEPYKQYSMIGTLMEKGADGSEAGYIHDRSGNIVQSRETYFTASETGSGSVVVEFSFYAGMDLAGKTAVAYEEIPGIITHADITDQPQTNYFPKIGTTVVDAETNTQISNVDSSVTLIDTVSYENLIPGRTYTLVGYIMEKATGARVTDASGNDITATATITPDTASGSVDVTFNFDATALKTNGRDFDPHNRDIVVFEYMYDSEDNTVASHEEITDEGQTIHFPDLQTTANTTLHSTNTNHIQVNDNTDRMTITDTVRLCNLLPATEYTIKGILMDKNTGEPYLDANGNTVTVEKTDYRSPAAIYGQPTVNDTTELVFEFDGRNTEGMAFVVFETLYYNTQVIADHSNIEDEGQTIYFPQLWSEIKDNGTDSHVSNSVGTVSLTERVFYKGLQEGKTYTINTELHIRDDNGDDAGVLRNASGNPVKASTTFVAEESISGAKYVDITISFEPAADIAGKTVVAFDTLPFLGVDNFVAHEDIDDDAQTIYFPEIKTTVQDSNTETQLSNPEKAVTLVDTVSYKNLETGKSYILSGKLMDKNSGLELTDASGAPIAVEQSFTAADANGTAKITFNFDPTNTYVNGQLIDLHNTDIVVFETLKDTHDKPVATHEDITDEDQTIHFPFISTSAKDGRDGDNHILADGTAVIKDTVTYKNLLPNTTYTIQGVLMTKDGAAYKTSAGNQVTAFTTFETSSADFGRTTVDGTADVEFRFDATDTDGTVYVVFEKLFFNNVELASHEDIEDDGQTIYNPKVITTLVDKITRNKISLADGDIVLVDTVSYEGCEPGKTYVLQGTLMERNADGSVGNVVLSQSGVPVTAIQSFDASESGEGTVEVIFTFKAGADLAGKTVVAYEELVGYAEHKDIADYDQTVFFPRIRTTVRDENTGIQNSAIASSVTIIDTVTYENLVAGKTYTVTGKLMDKATGNVLQNADGSEITSTISFTAPASSGSIDMEFTFDATALKSNDADFDAEDRDAVVFERMYDADGNVIAIHEDLGDGGQTIHFPKIRTSANAELHSTNKVNHIQVNTNTAQMTITDTVEMKNLMPATEYTLIGVLMNKNTGETYKDKNGNEVTVTYSFTSPTAIAGQQTVDTSEDIEFKFDGRTTEGMVFVVYETLLHDGKLIAEHKDIEDENQTIYFPKIWSHMTDSITKNDVSLGKGSITLVERVYYKGLQPGKTYTVNGELHEKAANGKDAGALLDAYGNPVVSSATFVAETYDESFVDVAFTFDASEDLAGKTVVAYASIPFLTVDKFVVHEIIEDLDETVHFPKIGTTVLDKESSTTMACADEDVTLVDTVSYENLVPGRSYTAIGTLMDKESGKEIRDEAGNIVTGTTTFVPEHASGTVDVEIHFNAKALMSSGSAYDAEDKDVVVFEDLLDANGKLVADHNDITDLGQTIHFPWGRTTATDTVTDSHHALAAEDIEIKDVVVYKNLLPNKRYTVTGTLMNKDTGDKVLDDDNHEITASATFTTPAAEDGRVSVDGSVEITFKFSGVKLAGVRTVAFETIYYKNAPVMVHADIDDEDESIYIPGGHTTLTDNATVDHLTNADQAVVTDRFEYTNLLPNTEYKLTGQLMVKETGKVLTVNGKPVTATKIFTSGDANVADYNATAGHVDMEFALDASALKGDTLVAFEQIWYNGHYILLHENLNDVDETTYIPDGHTTATDSETNDHLAMADEEIIIHDIVEYSNLLSGKQYKVIGTLMDKETGLPVVDADGVEVKSKATFVAPGDPDALLPVSGSVEIIFKFNGVGFENRSVVAFETITYKDHPVFVHANIKDEDQTVHIPEIGTTAADLTTEDRISLADSEITIIDTVHYENLLPNKEYTMTGILMDEDTGAEFLDANGDKVTGSTTFTTGAAEEGKTTVSGDVEVKFTFDGSLAAGSSVVAFEDLYYKNVKVAAHADLEDEAQTVYIPDGGTTALDKITEDQMTLADKFAKIVDTVAYYRLLPNRDYVVKGVLIDKDTGKSVQDNGKDVIVTKTFKAGDSDGYVDGTVDITFEFDASPYEGHTLVAFETIYYNNHPVVIHEDIDDIDETIFVPKGRTTATDTETEDHIAMADEMITIVDEVRYENLLAGRSYKVLGTLMDKETGEPILVNGQAVTAEETLIIPGDPETAVPVSGSIEIVFRFSGIGFENKTVVAFETVTYKDHPVIVHADINDEEETIHIPEIHTSVEDSLTADRISLAAEEVTIIDTVAYQNLLPNKNYVMKGYLMDEDTGKAYLDSDGNAVIGETAFTTGEANNGMGGVDGTVEVKFTFNGVMHKGSTLVAFEEVYYKNVKVAAHADLEDEAQTGYIPNGSTTAYDRTVYRNSENHVQDQMTLAAESAKIVDVVKYERLLPNREYTINGKLMVKETGEPLVIDGKEITASTTFVTGDSDGYVNGSVEMVFTLDASQLEGMTLVAFERILLNGTEVLIHEDINDVEETIFIPEGHTTALDSDTEDHMSLADEEITIVDTVEYRNLLAGRTYKVLGTMIDKDTGLPVMVNGQAVTAEADLVIPAEAEDPTPVSGSIDIVFTFNGVELAGKSIVAFETVTYEGVPVIVHAYIEDDEETVHIPKIETTAKDEITEDRIALASESITIVDTVHYEKLLPNKDYVMTGILMDEDTGKAFLDSEGNEVTASRKFSTGNAPEGEDTVSGEIDITFTFDGSLAAGTTLVAFETLQYKGKNIAIHADIEDEAQTVYIPDGHTNAYDKNTNERMTLAEENAKVVDVVTYERLLPEKEYTVVGTLMDKATGQPLMIDDKPVTATTKFTTEASDGYVDGSVELIFEFDASLLAGETLVAFETVYYNGKEVFIHADIDDEDQTIHIPDGYTTATDSETGNHTSFADKEVTIIDEVVYENLIPGKTYHVKGTLMDKETGMPVMVNDAEVIAEADFTPEVAEDTEDQTRVSGSVEIAFTFDGSALEGKTVVAFEEVSVNEKNVFVHADLEDEAQTIHFPKVRTSVSDKADGDRRVYSEGRVTMVDTVSYENLTVGAQYKVSGIIMNKSNGQPLMIDGQPVVAETTFIPAAANGTVALEFSFDATKVSEGKYVVFEYVYEMIPTEELDGNDKPIIKEVIIGSHEDLEDADQTFQVEKRVVKTGDTTPVELAIAATAAFAVAGASVMIARRKKEDNA